MIILLILAGIVLETVFKSLKKHILNNRAKTQKRGSLFILHHISVLMCGEPEEEAWVSWCPVLRVIVTFMGNLILSL
jgi:hypothetical protein